MDEVGVSRDGAHPWALQAGCDLMEIGRVEDMGGAGGGGWVEAGGTLGESSRRTTRK